MSGLIKERRAYADHMVEWFCMMVGCSKTLPPNERLSLERWEKANLDGATVGTSDWPGWEKYIGRKPEPPEYLRPKVKAKAKASISIALRIRVYRRDGFKCVFCGSEDRLTIDHKIPESKGGETNYENLQTACWPCNNKKGVRCQAS